MTQLRGVELTHPIFVVILIVQSTHANNAIISVIAISPRFAETIV